MLTFKDLKWISWQDGVASSPKFDNGFELSIVAGPHMYSTPKDKSNSPDDFSSFEVAVFDPQGNWITQQFFPDHHDDVVGWLNRDDINDLMNRIANHSKPQKDIPGFEGTLDQLNKLNIR